MFWVALVFLVGAGCAEAFLSDRIDPDLVGVISALGAFIGVGIMLALVFGLVG